MERKLRDALPGGEGALRAAVWEFTRPMLALKRGRPVVRNGDASRARFFVFGVDPAR
jgi:hypothetical protein